MKKTVIGLVALSVGFLTAATPAVAQLAALPVYASPKGGTGFSLSADVGRCMSECGGGANPMLFGGRARVGLTALSFGVGAGLYNDDVDGTDSKVAFAANGSFTLFGGPLIPVSVGVTTGVGILKQGDVATIGEFSDLVVPIALGIGFNIPTPGFSFDPWIAPRVQITREGEITGPLGVVSPSNTDLEFGFSAGIDGTLAAGFGFHAAIDFLNDSADLRNNASASQITFGIGVQYTFNVPGLPIVPIL